MKIALLIPAYALAGCLLLASCGGDLSLEARLAKAGKQMQEQQYEKALNTLRPALVDHSTDADLLYLISQAYLGVDKPDSAHYYMKQYTA
ncbi:MAG: hypothetical protein ACFFEM_15020, partial [Candidatus Thorarchaeota archaeon]